MTAQLIDGNALAEQARAEVARRAGVLRSRGRHTGARGQSWSATTPPLRSTSATRSRTAKVRGMRSVLERYPATMGEADLLARVRALNTDSAVHGILVQMPLPRHIDPLKVIATLSPDKDVDGFHVQNAGALHDRAARGSKPCTPYGCMKLIESTDESVRGKHAVVIGRSNTVGKPMALMLLQANATVTVCHSATPDSGHAHAAGRHRGGRGRPPQHGARRDGQTRRDRDRRRHESR